MSKLAYAVSSLAMACIFSSCASPYREAGRLEIQVRLQQAGVSSEPKQGAWYELVFVGGRSYASTFDGLMNEVGPRNTYFIEEILWSGDYYGKHTAYLLLYAKGYGGPDITLRGNPQVVSLELKRDTPDGEWSEWMAPSLSEVSGNSGWNLIYQTKHIRLVPLEEKPLGEIRYRIVKVQPQQPLSPP